MGLKHDLAKSSMNASIQRVVAALNDMAKNVIKWPAGDHLDSVKQKFQRLSNMPDVIGAIDGCNISIEAPKVCIVTVSVLFKWYIFLFCVLGTLTAL